MTNFPTTCRTRVKARTSNLSSIDGMQVEVDHDENQLHEFDVVQGATDCTAEFESMSATVSANAGEITVLKETTIHYESIDVDVGSKSARKKPTAKIAFDEEQLSGMKKTALEALMRQHKLKF